MDTLARVSWHQSALPKLHNIILLLIRDPNHGWVWWFLSQHKHRNSSQHPLHGSWGGLLRLHNRGNSLDYAEPGHKEVLAWQKAFGYERFLQRGQTPQEANRRSAILRWEQSDKESVCMGQGWPDFSGAANQYQISIVHGIQESDFVASCVLLWVHKSVLYSEDSPSSQDLHDQLQRVPLAKRRQSWCK